MIDILHETLISLSMSEDLDIHEKKLATDKYEDLFDVVLTDRSFEFNKSNLF